MTNNFQRDEDRQLRHQLNAVMREAMPSWGAPRRSPGEQRIVELITALARAHRARDASTRAADHAYSRGERTLELRSRQRYAKAELEIAIIDLLLAAGEIPR